MNKEELIKKHFPDGVIGELKSLKIYGRMMNFAEEYAQSQKPQWISEYEKLLNECETELSAYTEGHAFDEETGYVWSHRMENTKELLSKLRQKLGEIEPTKQS